MREQLLAANREAARQGKSVEIGDVLLVPSASEVLLFVQGRAQTQWSVEEAKAVIAYLQVWVTMQETLGHSVDE